MESNDKEFYSALIVVIIAIFVGSTMGYLAFLEGLPLWLSGVLSFFVGLLSLFCGMFANVE
jgi:hypothetical protein